MKVKVTTIDHHCGHDVVHGVVDGKRLTISVRNGYQCKNALLDKRIVFRREASYYRDGLRLIDHLLDELEPQR